MFKNLQANKPTLGPERAMDGRDGPSMMLMLEKALRLDLRRPLGLTRYKCIVREWSFLKSAQLHQQRCGAIH